VRDPVELEPNSFSAVAEALARASAEHHSVRIRGGGTKLEWGAPAASSPDVDLRTTALSRITEHNVGDLTAVLQAGVAVARAQKAFAAEGQMLALDPPLGIGGGDGATIGGMIATGDSGPLRHRYGAPRELIVGMTVALSDGTVARSGGKVIKNVAGYDLGKLFAGSFGTLGVILSVSVRLHPVPAASATALGASSEPSVLASAARALAMAPLELEALDIAWRAGRGGILARCGGVEASRRCQRVAALMRREGLEQVDVSTEDAELWARQRAGQRSRDRALLAIAAPPSSLAELLGCAQACAGTLVGRAALGSCFVELDPGALPRLRAELPRGAKSVLVDAPAELRAAVDPWGCSEGPALELCKRVKARFDPSATCNPGVFVGGI